jgi:hypothetical protein
LGDVDLATVPSVEEALADRVPRTVQDQRNADPHQGLSSRQNVPLGG